MNAAHFIYVLYDKGNSGITGIPIYGRGKIAACTTDLAMENRSGCSCAYIFVTWSNREYVAYTNNVTARAWIGQSNRLG